MSDDDRDQLASKLAESLRARVTQLDRKSKQLRTLLSKAYVYLSSHCDEGPAGEGWKSEDLCKLLNMIHKELDDDDGFEW